MLLPMSVKLAARLACTEGGYERCGLLLPPSMRNVAQVKALEQISQVTQAYGYVDNRLQKHFGTWVTPVPLTTAYNTPVPRIAAQLGGSQIRNNPTLMALISSTDTQALLEEPIPDEAKKAGLFKGPTTTPGLIPLHLKKATAADIPIIEIVQRFISHLKLGSGASVEKFIALVALFKVVKPAWRYLKDFLRFFGSRISIPETDPVAQDATVDVRRNHQQVSHYHCHHSICTVWSATPRHFRLHGS